MRTRRSAWDIHEQSTKSRQGRNAWLLVDRKTGQQEYNSSTDRARGLWAVRCGQERRSAHAHSRHATQQGGASKSTGGCQTGQARGALPHESRVEQGELRLAAQSRVLAHRQRQVPVLPRMRARTAASPKRHFSYAHTRVYTTPHRLQAKPRGGKRGGHGKRKTAATHCQQWRRTAA